jgi:hypothetical protein
MVSVKGPFLLALGVSLILGAGCAGQALPTGVLATSTPNLLPATPTSSPTIPPGSTPSSGLGPTELKYRLIAQFGDPFFCDPDYYPVAHVLSEVEFQRRFAEIQKNTEVYQTILQHLGLTGQAVLSPEQERLVYAEYKKLNAISLQPVGENYQFSLRIPAGQPRGTAIDGSIDANGNNSVTKTQPSFNTCPICLATNSLVATPNGEIRVQDLRRGMPIWTADASGVKRTAVVLETVKRNLPDTVALVDLVLEDGRELLVSPGHPLTDGRSVGALAIGDIVDGARVVSVKGVPYKDDATYDVLPSGETGFYWANGVLLKSTLAP